MSTTAFSTIEDIILQRDQRGVAALRPHLPADYAVQAAQYVLDHPGTTFITTGFYILYGGTVETDGPPGAMAIGKALEKLGRKVVYVTDKYCLKAMKTLASPKGTVEEFPVTDLEGSNKAAKVLIDKHKPALLISIERSSPSRDGIYRNMRSTDVSSYTAKVDAMFRIHPNTVGIGDGGNEIGMGLLEEFIPKYPKLPQLPAAVACKKLIIASVSNWGGYGLVAAMSKLSKRNLLPTLEEEAGWVKQCVDQGLVDGFTGEAKLYVDGFPMDEYQKTLKQLHDLLKREGVKGK
ncbi:MAG: DUF4392 domain-containing protein [SAR202 cluster bacterium]|nr:DUF4392 domain-containing protein [SAR202 cluster bacterium]